MMKIISQILIAARLQLLRALIVAIQVLAGLCLVSANAHADWADIGVSWRCDEIKNTLSIRPVVNTSSGERIALQPGFSMVVDGFQNKPPYTTTLQCNLPGAAVNAVVYSRGGTYQLNMVVNNTTIFDRELFNSGFGLVPTPYQVEVVSQGRGSTPSITVCSGIWSWDKNYDEGVCNPLKTR